ncbi:hypothetical protein [Corynebacterium sp. ES2715-CONJ3]|uniref:hypothetical protein n=1 Tax=Corynebacterium sp. ES2715-CONJ3 TaxID=2974028 RepID=UPI00216760E5|nr:hypothetical protein [Corynebacterium sp. ES2715-CONJ3]MCS4490984.1 hypothetical protein [Corynebacterium sp. ES2715-CONJ3]
MSENYLEKIHQLVADAQDSTRALETSNEEQVFAEESKDAQLRRQQAVEAWHLVVDACTIALSDDEYFGEHSGYGFEVPEPTLQVLKMRNMAFIHIQHLKQQEFEVTVDIALMRSLLDAAVELYNNYHQTEQFELRMILVELELMLWRLAEVDLIRTVLDEHAHGLEQQWNGEPEQFFIHVDFFRALKLSSGRSIERARALAIFARRYPEFGNETGLDLVFAAFQISISDFMAQPTKETAEILLLCSEAIALWDTLSQEFAQSLAIRNSVATIAKMRTQLFLEEFLEAQDEEMIAENHIEISVLRLHMMISEAAEIELEASNESNALVDATDEFIGLIEETEVYEPLMIKVLYDVSNKLMSEGFLRAGARLGAAIEPLLRGHMDLIPPIFHAPLRMLMINSAIISRVDLQRALGLIGEMRLELEMAEFSDEFYSTSTNLATTQATEILDDLELAVYYLLINTENEDAVTAQGVSAAEIQVIKGLDTKLSSLEEAQRLRDRGAFEPALEILEQGGALMGEQRIGGLQTLGAQATQLQGELQKARVSQGKKVPKVAKNTITEGVKRNFFNREPALQLLRKFLRRK